MDKQEQVVLDQGEIAQAIERMAAELIRGRESGDRLALVGIRTRGVHIANRLADHIARATGVELPQGAVDINLYRDDWTRIGLQPVLQATQIPFSIDGAHVVLVDDVLYTGRTIRAAMDALMDFGRPDRIELAVLVDRGHRELPICADFTGKTVETLRSDRINVYMQENDGVDQVVWERS